MIPLWPLVAGFELVGPDELANVMAAQIACRSMICLSLAITPRVVVTSFGGEFSPKVWPFLRVMFSVNS